MATVVEAPLELMETLAEFRLPANADRRLQLLMDRNTEGALDREGRDELEALVEISESIALLRAQALHVLGRTPR